MTKTSSLLQRNRLRTTLISLFCFVLLRSACSWSSFANIDLSIQTLNPQTTGFMIRGSPTGDRVRAPTKTAGDVDGDGYDDIIVPLLLTYMSSYIGAVYVIYGGEESSFLNMDLSTRSLNPLTTGFMIKGPAASDAFFGQAVSTAGDINNDGYDDIIIGAYGINTQQGEAFVIYGGPKSSMSNIDLSSTSLNPLTTGFKITGKAANDRLGWSVSTAGDINNDGYDDIIIGIQSTGLNQGSACVIYGREKSSMSNIDLSTQTLDPSTTGFMLKGNSDYNFFGSSVSTAGDINNDGYDDFIVGVPYKDSLQGAAYVIYGGPKSSMSNIDLSTQTLAPSTTGFMLTGSAANDQFGISVSAAGDINNDGYDDIIVGASGKSNKGAAYVIYGGEKSSMSNWDFSSGALLNPTSTGFLMTGNAVNDQFGYSVSTAGDLNRDGYDDIIIGAYSKNSNRGAASVIYGGPKSTMTDIVLSSTPLNPTSTGFMITGNAGGDYFGMSVSTAGDINNDGFDEIIVAAPGKNSVGGAAYMIFIPHPCPAHCKQCSSESVCTECQSSYYLYESECFVSCPDTTFGSTTKTCEDCPANCKHCSGTSVCTECQSPYLIYQSECFATCPEATLATSTTLCEDCPSHCHDCSSTSVCTQCENLYLMYQSKCFNTCPEATVATSSSTCEDCPANCNHCSSSSVCTECENLYFLYQSECFASCPDTTFAISTTTCEDCSTNCKHCSSSSVCTECQSPYLMYNSECFATCPGPTVATSSSTCEDCPANCNECSSASICTQCENLYFIYNSECFVSCPETTFASTTTTCQDCSADCKYCTSPSVCTECENSHLMYNSECFASCPDRTFAISTTTCGDCSAHCNHCSSISVCTECQSPYFMYNSECFATCPEATVATSSTLCEDCPANCNECSSASICTQCENSYLMYNSQCFASCPDTTFADTTTTCQDCSANCNHCTSSSVCTECENSYLMYNSECFASCPDTTFAISATACGDCPANCNHCSSASVCTECESSYLLYNSECFSACPDATIATSSTLCEDCPANCNECSSASICTQCENSYLMYNSQCFASCPDTTFADTTTTCQDCSTNCNHCTSNSVCTECKSPYLLYESGCFVSCPDTTFAISTTTCEDCPADCKHCSSASVCTECQISYLMYKSECFATCPEATVSTSPTTCEGCPAHCDQCSSPSVCTECQSPYRLYQSECVDSCPDAMFLSTTTCEDCPTNCNHCASSSICTECISPFVFYESVCLPSCPKAMFNDNNECKDCPAYCSSCTSQDSCQVCYKGFTLSNSLCIAPVPAPIPEPVPSSSSYQEVQEKAIQRISSAAKMISSAVCVGRTVAPFAMLASKTVQNTRYLDLSVTNHLSEVYQTWDKDLIPWKLPNSFSKIEDDFEASPPLFARYATGSPFLVNFWPIFINIAGGLTLFITWFVLQKLLEKSKHENWIFLVQNLFAGSFSFTLIQAYVCLDDILFYLVLDMKANPFNSFFSCASLIIALIFLAFGCLLVLFNLWTVKKYQKTKKQELKDIKVFNEKNKYWKLFYADFNDNDPWCQSFLALLIIRSTLSSLIITAFYDYPLMQTLFLVMLDVSIILFLYLKNPFKTLRGKLAQYFYEITTLLVHISTFSLSLKPSDSTKSVFSTAIIYLNTVLILGAVGFMSLEIFKTISAIIEQKKAARLKDRQVVPVENQENQNLNQTKSPLNALETDRNRPDWANQDQTVSVGTFTLLPEALTPNVDVESPIMKPPARAQNRRRHKISSIFPVNN